MQYGLAPCRGTLELRPVKPFAIVHQPAHVAADALRGGGGGKGGVTDNGGPSQRTEGYHGPISSLRSRTLLLTFALF